jgi:division protein CdvB (Snf7/Vps24/ESCRT-III family)
MVAVRMIEQQRQALEVMADLIDSFLTIAETQMAERADTSVTEDRRYRWPAGD